MWQRIGKHALASAQAATNVGAGGVADIISPGIIVALSSGTAIWVRRFVSGVVNAAGVFELIADGTAQVVVPAVVLPAGLATATISGVPSLTRKYGAPVAGTGVPNVTTGDQVAIIDDWYEFDDFRDLGVAPVTLTFRGIWRVLNSSGLAANILSGPDFLYYDLYQTLSPLPFGAKVADP